MNCELRNSKFGMIVVAIKYMRRKTVNEGINGKILPVRASLELTLTTCVI